MEKKDALIYMMIASSNADKNVDGIIISEKEIMEIKRVMKQEKLDENEFNGYLKRFQLHNDENNRLVKVLIEEVKTYPKEWRRKIAGSMVRVECAESEGETISISRKESELRINAEKSWRLEHEDVMRGIHLAYKIR